MAAKAKAYNKHTKAYKEYNKHIISSLDGNKSQATKQEARFS
jgi:hypothetical protein